MARFSKLSDSGWGRGSQSGSELMGCYHCTSTPDTNAFEEEQTVHALN